MFGQLLPVDLAVVEVRVVFFVSVQQFLFLESFERRLNGVVGDLVRFVKYLMCAFDIDFFLFLYVFEYFEF